MKDWKTEYIEIFGEDALRHALESEHGDEFARTMRRIHLTGARLELKMDVDHAYMRSRFSWGIFRRRVGEDILQFTTPSIVLDPTGDSEGSVVMRPRGTSDDDFDGETVWLWQSDEDEDELW